MKIFLELEDVKSDKKNLFLTKPQNLIAYDFENMTMQIVEKAKYIAVEGADGSIIKVLKERKF